MQTDKKIRKRHNWKALVELWESTSISKAEFCRQNSLPSSSFYKALQQFQNPTDKQDEAPHFVKARVIDSQPADAKKSKQECVIEFSNKARMILPNISSKFLRDILMGD